MRRSGRPISQPRCCCEYPRNPASTSGSVVVMRPPVARSKKAMAQLHASGRGRSSSGPCGTSSAWVSPLAASGPESGSTTAMPPSARRNTNEPIATRSPANAETPNTASATSPPAAASVAPSETRCAAMPPATAPNPRPRRRGVEAAPSPRAAWVPELRRTRSKSDAKTTTSVTPSAARTANEGHSPMGAASTPRSAASASDPATSSQMGPTRRRAHTSSGTAATAPSRLMAMNTCAWRTVAP